VIQVRRKGEKGKESESEVMVCSIGDGEGWKGRKGEEEELVEEYSEGEWEGGRRRVIGVLLLRTGGVGGVW
jgi:hypothetical protein